MHHRAIDQRRKGSGREIQGTPVLEQSEGQDPSIDLENDVCAAMEAVQVRKALATLPPLYQQTLTLRYFGGLSHSEIARKLAVPPGTVKSRQHHALRKLRAILDGAALCPVASDVAGAS